MENKKIVIIDNDKEILGKLEDVLSASGYAPVVVNDVPLAVDIAVRSNPDAILVELKMPFKNGFEIADEINHILEIKKVPIIGMSAFFKDEFAFLLNLCGIDSFIKKPFNPLDVIWAIENVIGARDQPDEERYLARAEEKLLYTRSL